MMDTTINVNLEEVCRVYDILEKIHDVMHQPEKYQDINMVGRFVEENYSEVKELYYNIVWNWLPSEKKHEIEER